MTSRKTAAKETIRESQVRANKGIVGCVCLYVGGGKTTKITARS